MPPEDPFSLKRDDCKDLSSAIVLMSQFDNWAHGEVPKMTANRRELLKMPDKDGKLQVVFEEADKSIDK